MRRAVLALFALLAASAVCGTAAAVEVQPSIDGSVSYTDNLFSSQTDEQGDWYITGSPGLAIYDEAGQLQWELVLEPTYVVYTKFEDLNGWEYDVDGSMSWRITPRTTVRVGERFRRLNSVSRFNELSDVGGAPVGIDGRPGLNPFNRNLADIGIEHTLTSRIFLYANYTNAILEFTRDDVPDRLNQEAAAGFSYLLRRYLRTGLRASWSQSDVKPEGFPDRVADFYNLSVTLNWAPSDATTIDLSAGPTLVQTQAPSFTNPAVPVLPTQEASNGTLFYTDLGTCSQLDDGTFFLSSACQRSVVVANLNGTTLVPQQSSVGSIDESDVTYFANASLTHRWSEWMVNLAFRREDDRSVSSGASGIVNVGSVRVEYEPFPRWRFTLSGAYILRESTTESVVNVLTLQPAGVIEFTPLPPLNFGIFQPPVAESSARRLVAFDSESKIKTLRTFFRAGYQITDRARVTGTLYWTSEKEDFNGSQIREYDRFTGWIGITYDFEPIAL